MTDNLCSGMKFQDVNATMVLDHPLGNNKGSDWWCENEDGKGGLWLYSASYIQMHLLSVPKKEMNTMKLFVRDVERNKEEIDMRGVIRLELEMPDGTAFFIHEDEGKLVIHTNLRVKIQPKAANMIELEGE